MSQNAVAKLVGELDRLLARTLAERDVSASRARQLRWVVGELTLALGHPDFDTRRLRGARDLFAGEPVTAYLALAARGELRRRATTGTGHATDASLRIRADCLKLLGETCGTPVTVSDRPGLPDLHEPVAGPIRSELLDFLRHRAGRLTSPPGRVRLFAIVGVVIDTGSRVGELCALRLDDLDERLHTVRVQRRPQACTVSEPVEETLRLSAGTREALRHWLSVREELVAVLRGSATALWVSVAANHAGVPAADGHAVRRPPGMPLRPRGLQRAYTRGVAEANAALVGTPGWQPLPYRLEQLRRAVTGQPV